MRIVPRALLAALALASPAGSVRADESVPDAAALRAKVAAAAALPADYRETTVTTSSTGITTTVHYARHGADWRESVDRGPFHTESGSVGRQAWHQNDNGQTVVDEPDPGRARPDPTTTTLERVRRPEDAYRLSVLNARGFGIRSYYDPVTFHLVRRETVGANGTVVTTFDDFRREGDREFAHHWAVVNAYANTTSETRVTAYDASPVPIDAVAMPPSRRHLVEFPPGEPPVVLPTAFAAEHVIVHAAIGGRGLDFVLDTGASGISIDNGVAHQLGLPMYDEHSAVTAGRYTTARTLAPEMRVGALRMRDVAMQIIPDGVIAVPGIRAVGLLGFDFLAELGVTIDYEHERVTVVPEPQYVAPAGAPVFALGVRIGRGVPMTDVAINGALSERFLLDTGGGGTFLIFDAFARKHPEALRDAGGGVKRARRFRGVGGAFDTQPYEIESVRLGALNFERFVGYRVTSSGSYQGTDDGVIGAEFLRLFTLGLDYANSRVYLVPNSDGRKAMGIKA